MSLYEPSRAVGRATGQTVRDVRKMADEGSGGREQEGSGHFWLKFLNGLFHKGLPLLQHNPSYMEG